MDIVCYCDTCGEVLQTKIAFETPEDIVIDVVPCPDCMESYAEDIDEDWTARAGLLTLED